MRNWRYWVLVVGLMGLTPRVSAQIISPILTDMNGKLEALDAHVRVHRAEMLVIPGNGVLQGITIFADDRMLQLGTRWAPGDVGRNALDSTLRYLVDQSEGAATGGLTNADTEAAIDRAMYTWDFGTTCSNLPLMKVADSGLDPDLVDFLAGFGPPPAWLADPALFPLADIIHAGWLPAGFFDAIDPGSSAVTLGITFTFIFVDADVNPTDINGDGFFDTAWKETYYNNAFPWGIDSVFAIDVETVALHESGHGLEQGHFGKIFLSDVNGMVHFAPRAVMNAAYSGIQQDLSRVDLGGHCSLFGRWPN
jgi:hypothetical protein